MIDIKQVLLLKPHKGFKRQSSLDTLIGEEEIKENKETFFFYNNKKKKNDSLPLPYDKKEQYIYQVKKIIQHLYQLNEQWQENRAFKRQKRKEKRPQDGKTNPFE